MTAGKAYRIKTHRGDGVVKIIRTVKYTVGEIIDAVVVSGSFVTQKGRYRAPTDYVCFRPAQIIQQTAV